MVNFIKWPNSSNFREEYFKWKFNEINKDLSLAKNAQDVSLVSNEFEALVQTLWQEYWTVEKFCSKNKNPNFISELSQKIDFYFTNYSSGLTLLKPDDVEDKITEEEIKSMISETVFSIVKENASKMTIWFDKIVKLLNKNKDSELVYLETITFLNRLIIEFVHIQSYLDSKILWINFSQADVVESYVKNNYKWLDIAWLNNLLSHKQTLRETLLSQQTQEVKNIYAMVDDLILDFEHIDNLISWKQD